HIDLHCFPTRRCSDLERLRPPRDAYLRAGRPGTARSEVHEDHLARAGGVVIVKIKKGDTVLVTSGKDKGAKGKVIQAYPERELRSEEHTSELQSRFDL